MGIFEIFNWIYSFEEETKVDLYEPVSDLKREVFLNKNEKGLFFKLGYPHFKLLYKKETSFIISHDLFKIKINNFLAYNDSQSIVERFCKAYIFQSLNFDESDEKYHCYYSKIDDFFLMSFFAEWQKEFSLNIEGINFKISTCDISCEIKHTFLCIECKAKISFKHFKHYVNNLIVSAAFFTGKFYKLEEFYFQSHFDDFSCLTDVFYRNSNTNYSFPSPITKNPKSFDWKFSSDFVLTKVVEQEWASHIEESKFISLINLLISKPKIYFSIRIIFDFYKSPSMSRIPLMFVVLETICEEFKNLNSPIIESVVVKEIANKVLLKHKEIIPVEDFNILSNAIGKIDKKIKGNIVNFEKVFAQLKIVLNKEDKETLIKRNDFFHGIIIPDEESIGNEEDYYKIEKEYIYYSYRLYVLISKLILKKIDFSGYILNYPKLFEDISEKKIDENYFIKI